MTRHFLEMDDLSAAELNEVLDQAEKRHPSPVLDGKGVALLFEKPSARTRSSMEMAVVDLGGHPAAIRSEEVDLDGREPVEDVGRTLAGFHAAIGARVLEHSSWSGYSRGRSGDQPLSDEPIPSRPWPTSWDDPSDPGRLRWSARPTWATATTWPASDDPGVAGRHGGPHAACPQGWRPRTTTRLRRPGALPAEFVDRPEEAVRGRRRLHRRLDVDGTGGGRRGHRRASGFHRARDDLMDRARPEAIFLNVCPPTAVRRSPPTSSTAWRGARPQIAANRRHAAQP